MRSRDSKPMMSTFENWQWLIRETMPYGSGRAQCTELARTALRAWTQFIERRANRVR